MTPNSEQVRKTEHFEYPYDVLLAKQESKKSVEREKRIRNAEHINWLIVHSLLECALRTAYCATQLNVIETECKLTLH